MSQSSFVSGEHNVVIQIVGDANVVYLPNSGARLTLTRYLNRRVPLSSDIDYLDPYCLAAPLVGRQSEIVQLNTWLTTTQTISVSALSGAGGCGKTRLALDLVEKAIGQGWNAGFLEGRELSRFTQSENATSWVWNTKTLIIIDDAASNSAAIRTWLHELADNTASNAPALRILLLERYIDLKSGWWEHVFEGGWEARAVRRLLDTHAPIEIKPITLTDRLQLFAAIIARRETKGLAASFQIDSARFQAALAKQSWTGHPLFLIMAALLASRERIWNLLSLARTDLAKEIAMVEKARLQRIARSSEVEVPFFLHLSAIVTLSRSVEIGRLQGLIAEERNAEFYCGSSTDPPRLEAALRQALPQGPTSVQGISPDIVGEAFIFSILTERAGHDAILRAGARQLVNVATTIIYSAQDYVDDDVLKDIRSWFSKLILSRDIELKDREEILRVMHGPGSLALREQAEFLLSNVLEEKRAAGRGYGPGRYATPQLIELSVRLSAGGKDEEALAAAAEAVNTSRFVKERLRRANYPDLQNALMVYAEALSGVGRWAEALTAAEEGVELIRGQYFPDRMSDDDRRDLCWTLLCLADILAGNERHEEALAIAAESVQFAREMIQADPESQSRALLNYANRLYEAKRFDEAVSCGLESLNLYRELAAARPDEHLRTLGYIIQRLVAYCLGAGRADEAVSYAEEVVTVERRIAKADPTSRKHLIGSLEALNILLERVGRGRESVLRELEEIAAQDEQGNPN